MIINNTENIYKEEFFCLKVTTYTNIHVKTNIWFKVFQNWKSRKYITNYNT